jgi:hypothetical protein
MSQRPVTIGLPPPAPLSMGSMAPPPIPESTVIGDSQLQPEAKKEIETKKRIARIVVTLAAMKWLLNSQRL